MAADELDLNSEAVPEPGRFGRFYLQELINRGGVNDIWVATDENRQTFALRRMRKKSLFNFTDSRRFLNGCIILEELCDHPNIVKHIEHGKIERTPYLLMEYMEGSNLKSLLSRGDEVLAENVAQIIIDMAAGLEHVHDKGYLHLDFKPENIIVTRNASVRLIDFDLARPKPEEPKKFSGKNPGTPAYMAPEHLQGEAIDGRADIFGLGATMYEVLTTQKPYPGDTPDEILRKQLNYEIVPPRELNADIPPALEKVILKCLEPDMAARYPFMSVVTRDLHAALYI